MLSKPLYPILVGLVFLVSGCAGTSDVQDVPSGPDSETSVKETAPEAVGGSGAIMGTVLDDEQLPLAGVRVAIARIDAELVTNEFGGFRFLDVPTGTYEVSAVKIGYEAGVARSVAVQEGGEAEVTIELKPLPSPVPAVKTWTRSGADYYVAGVWAPLVLDNVPFYNCLGCKGSSVQVVDFEGRGDEIHDLLFEMVWGAGATVSPGSYNYTFAIGPSNGPAAASGPNNLCGAEGPSPLTCYASAERFDELLALGDSTCQPDKCSAKGWIGGPDREQRSSAVTYELQVSTTWDFYLSYALNAPLPEDYTATAE